MASPIWLDERGQRRPARQCYNCSGEVPVLRLRYEDLLTNSWKPLKPFFVMNWCEHGQEFIPWPGADDYWTLVPVLGEVA